jgi:hypothetical protein
MNQAVASLSSFVLHPSAFSKLRLLKAGEGNRTLVACLEGRGSTIELHPRAKKDEGWRMKDENTQSFILHPSALIPPDVGREGFEPP